MQDFMCAGMLGKTLSGKLGIGRESESLKGNVGEEGCRCGCGVIRASGGKPV